MRTGPAAPPMIIDLRRLEEGTGRLSMTEDVGVEDAFGEEKRLRCRMSVDYHRSAASAHFHISVTGDLETRCHRCLEPVMHPVTCEFDVGVRRGEESDPEADADFITVGRNEHEIDIGPVLHENVVVNVPMIILCREACKGLCPVCGVNRNRDTCACQQPQDPRWDALRKMGRDKQP